MATPKWFDANAYMQNKLAQLKAQEPDAGWTLDKLYDAFREGGFVGAEGQYEHFVKFGAAEEVAPNAYFNADEYYVAKPTSTMATSSTAVRNRSLLSRP